MSNSEFTAWLRGFLSGSEAKRPTPAQWAEIRRRLAGATQDVLAIPYNGPMPGLCPGDFAPVLTSPYYGAARSFEPHIAAMAEIVAEGATTVHVRYPTDGHA